MQHTKGPWKGRWTASTNDIVALIEPGKLALVASVWFGGRYNIKEEEAEANAHLIAAAPELLEALEHLATVYSQGNNRHQAAWHKAHAAIAKAKGDSRKESHD